MTPTQVKEPGRYRATHQHPSMRVEVECEVALSFGRLVVRNENGFGEIQLRNVPANVVFERVDV